MTDMNGTTEASDERWRAWPTVPRLWERQLARDCTIHYIKTSIVEKLILAAIRKVSAYVRKDEKRFCSLLPFVLSVAGIKIRQFHRLSIKIQN